jgi:glycosyltransferase involved in cell wall biosynthesis
MNILFLAQFPILENSGGVQRVTSILAEGFVEKGHQVYYLSTTEPIEKCPKNDRQYYTSSLNSAGMECSEFVREKNIDIIINQAGVYDHITKMLEIVRVNTNLVKILSVHHNCIACLNERYREILLGNGGATAALLKRYFDFKIIWVFLKWRNKVKYRGLFKRSIEMSDRLVLLAHKFKKELFEVGIKNLNNVVAIPNPASFEAFPAALAEKQNRIVFVGRLKFTQKRVDRLMEIYNKLHDKYEGWHFDILGDGSERRWMETYKKENGLSRVHFHGFQDPKPFLQRSKIFTLTSDFEGFGMVLLEAQAFGAVPVTFRCFSAIEDIVLRGSAMILEKFENDLFVNAVEQLILEPARLNSFAKMGLGNVARFQSKKVVDQWLELFKEL